MKRRSPGSKCTWPWILWGLIPSRDQFAFVCGVFLCGHANVALNVSVFITSHMNLLLTIFLDFALCVLGGGGKGGVPGYEWVVKTASRLACSKSSHHGDGAKMRKEEMNRQRRNGRIEKKRAVD